MFSSTRRFVVGVVSLTLLSAFIVFFDSRTINAESNETPVLKSATSTITDEAMDSFLFRVNEKVRSKILALGDEPIEQLPIPVLFGISVSDLVDTWGESRPGGRVHTGTDIIAPLGEMVVSPTDAVVTKIGYDNKGGNFVVTANPGGEQFYFAHLDRAAENLSVGDILKSGDLIGYVGNTGNARGTAPHLHFEIYYKEMARNPFPRLIREFSIEEKLVVAEKVLTENKIVLGANNGGVRFLQRFLIKNGAGSRANALASTGATGYFGPLTKAALAEYQQAINISPSSGYFGPITKARMLSALNQSASERVTEASTTIITESAMPHPLALQINNE